MTAATEALPASGCEAQPLARFRDLVRAEQDRAVRTAYRMLGGDYAAAEDVAQEAFLRAHAGLARFRGEASLSTWFYRILIREVQRHRRHQRARRFFSMRSLGELELPAPPRAGGDVALRKRMLAALEGLTRRQREAVILVHLEQFSVAETAALLGTSAGTVKTHVHRGMKALRHELGEVVATSGAGEAT